MRTSFLVIACTALAIALPAGTNAGPIPQTPLPTTPVFQGSVATPHPVAAPDPPRHPFMAPNERSNLHDDAYQTDSYKGYGPLGRGGISVTSTSYVSDCGSVTFDSRGRIVTVCVGIGSTVMKLLDPHTLAELASYTLPARNLLGGGGGNPFQNFTGGGYFYLDDADRAVLGASDHHMYVIQDAPDGPPSLKLVRNVDLTSHIPESDGIVSVLPDWAGRNWFITKTGIVGTVDRTTPAAKSFDTHEVIGNSFAVDETGGVYIVTNAAMYRFDADATGAPKVTWREKYDNTGVQKPGQSQAGSGTTPTLMGKDLVSITDNADPMDVVVYHRTASYKGAREVCRQPVFAKGASSSDQSLIGTAKSMVVENNYGYQGPQSTEASLTTTPGLTRVDINADGHGCHVVWTSAEIAPSVVPKLSLAAGLVYTYTKPAGHIDDPWYLTTLDFATGRTVFRALAGTGIGFNNNYAPVTLGSDATAYVGTLGGLVAMHDNQPPPPIVQVPLPKLVLTLSCARRARVSGSHVESVEFRAAGMRRRTDARAPYTTTLKRSAHGHVAASVTLQDGRIVTLRRKLRRCP
jgi:hypothetical protein